MIQLHILVIFKYHLIGNSLTVYVYILVVLTTEQYVMLGAEEGLFSLLVTDNPEPVMEQVSSRSCHWLRVVESALVWLAGSSRHINMTNLVLLFQTDASKANMPHARWVAILRLIIQQAHLAQLSVYTI